MIYVPSVEDACYTFYSDGIIIKLPYSFETNQEYTTQFIETNNHYLTYDRNLLVQENYNCIEHNKLTSSWYYRNDVSDIIILFLFICLFIVVLPYLLATRFWKWLK